MASCSTRATQRMRGELLRESPTSSQIAMETAYLRFLSVTSKVKADRAQVDEGSLRRRRFGSSRAARMGVRSDGDAIRPRTRRTEFEPRLWFNHRGSASGSSYRTAPGCLLGHHGRRPFLDASPHLASSSSYGGPRIPAGGRWNSLRDCVRAPRKHRYGSRSGRCSPAILRAERLHPSIPALVRAEPFGVAHKS